MSKEWLRVVLFLLVGGIQFMLDIALFVMLTHSGMASLYANLIARFSAALLGFLLNGKLTFRQSRLTGTQWWKYMLVWVFLTGLSTGAVVPVGRMAGLEMAWLMKALIEVLLAMLSFMLMRRWVFK